MKAQRIKPKYLLFGSLLAITLLFFVAAWLAYGQFKRDFVKNEFDNQKKMTRIVSQSINRYFETLKYVVENSVLHPAFSVERTEKENQLRFKTVPARQVPGLLESHGISKILTGPRTAQQTTAVAPRGLKYWQIFKAL